MALRNLCAAEDAREHGMRLELAGDLDGATEEYVACMLHRMDAAKIANEDGAASAVGDIVTRSPWLRMYAKGLASRQ